MKYQSKTKWKYQYLIFILYSILKMNYKDLKQVFIILKSQKLINCYDIEIYNKFDPDKKEYKTFFQVYNWKSYFINFWYMKNKNNKTWYIKNLIYENYIKN